MAIPVSYIVEWKEASGVTGAITKFGGRPWGLRQEDWPRSAKKQEPLEFIAQIVLEPHLFPGAEQQLAYVFWDPKSYGKYAGAVLLRQHSELTDSFAEGPAIRRVVLGPKRFFSQEKTEFPVEYEVRLAPGEEPELADLDIMLDEDDENSERLLKAHGMTLDELVEKIDVAKIGGTPNYIQDPAAKAPTDRLFLHLPVDRFPFHMALGDAGTFFAFVNQELTEGYGFWQCH